MAIAYAARSFAGGAQATTLASPMLNTDTTFTLVSATGWPTGASGNFWVDIDPGLPSEEKVLCSGLVGFVVTVVGRGGGSGDGTTAAAHNAGAIVRVVHVAQDDSEANALVANLGNLAVGSIPTGGGAATLPSSVAAVAAGGVLVSQGVATKPAWLAAGTTVQVLLGGAPPSWGIAAPPAVGLQKVTSFIGSPGTALIGPANLTSVSLTAGTWLIIAQVYFNNVSTTKEVIDAWLGPNSASAVGAYAAGSVAETVNAGGAEGTSFSFSTVQVFGGSQIVYLNYQCQTGSLALFESSTNVASIPDCTGITAVRIA